VASDGSFARQKGNLRLPVRGSVSGRFGSPRDGGGTWRGLFIKAAPAAKSRQSLMAVWFLRNGCAVSAIF
jgi:septal ring factor EnvC (AmiA/AmiB activator)